jgi:hypothetical protein
LRYALLLSEFDYKKIEYTKGRTHTLADSLSRRPFTQAERDQVEKSQKEVDPLFLSAISEELLEDMAPSDNQIWKSHSRHYRRHAKITHFAPITLQDTVHQPAPNLDVAQPQHSQLLSSADDSSDTAPFPTVDDIMNATENLPPISLQTQRTDEYFAKIIDFLELPGMWPRSRRLGLKAVSRRSNAQGCGLGLNASVSRPSRGTVTPRLGLASVEISNVSVSPRSRT